MDENQISWAWGGCGNLINCCLKSNQQYKMIQDYYLSIDDKDTWTNQEWKIRSRIGQIEHTVDTSTINLAWSNSLDTSFHYIIKNIVINHLSGSMLDRVSTVITYNTTVENSIRLRDCVILDNILQSSGTLYQWCKTIDPEINEDKIQFIYNTWRDKTKLFYEKNSLTVLGYFNDLGIDYTPTTLYTILYENPYTRQQQF